MRQEVNQHTRNIKLNTKPVKQQHKYHLHQKYIRTRDILVVFIVVDVTPPIALVVVTGGGCVCALVVVLFIAKDGGDGDGCDSVEAVQPMDIK
jgi:hypothetical protein